MRRWITLFAVFALLRASTAWAAYFPEPSPVVGGGTGLATLTAHAVVVGEGTANVALVGPGATAGVPLVSGGSSADPSFTTAVVAGGGTGLGTLTAHNVVLGEGTSNVAFAAPGATVGVPLISQNATTDPVFGTAVVAGGGTGLGTLTAHALLIGEGTANVAFAAAAADSIPLWQSSSADPTVTAIGICTGAGKALTYDTATHGFGCNTITAGAAPSLAVAATSASITLASINLLTTVSNNTTVATATLPSAVTVGSGFRECMKDGTEDFAAHNVTLKSTSGTMDGVAAATGVVMNQTHEELCAISDGTNWLLE